MTRPLTRAEFAMRFASYAGLDSVAPEYSDVTQDTFGYKAIGALQEAGLMTGSGGAFNPNATISRAEAATVFSRYFGLQGGENPFTDTGGYAWADPYLAGVAEAGLFEGVGGGRFDPGGGFTGAQFAIVTKRAQDYGITPPGAPVYWEPTPSTQPGGGATQPDPDEPLYTRDAYADITALLGTWGIEDDGQISNLIEQWIQADISPEAALWHKGTGGEPDLGLYYSDAFTTAFPEFWAVREAGNTPLTPGAIIDFRRQVDNELRRGMLPNVFGQNFYTDLLTAENGGISVLELRDRIEEGYSAVAESSTAVREKFAEYFGISGDQALALYFLDPDVGGEVLRERLENAEIGYVGGRASEFGFNLNLNRAGDIAEQNLSQAAIAAGFRNLQDFQAIFNETLSEDDDFTAEGIGVDAEFGLGGYNARQLLELRRLARVNALSGGGQNLLTQEGIVGSGSAT